MRALQNNRVNVRRYAHSATSKFIVSWGTGSTPSVAAISAWDLKNPDALPEDRRRFVAGTWQRHRRFFRTREDADNFALAKRTELANGDAHALALPLAQRVMAAACFERLKPYGFTLEHAVDFFIDHLKSTRRSVSVAVLIPEYVASKRQKGNRERSLKDVAHRLSVFEKSFGDRIVSNITTAEIDDWLTHLALSAQSQNNYRAVLRAFYTHAVRRDYARSNPVERIDKVKISDRPPGIFTPEQLTRLLDNATPATLPVLVIGAFAGLRQAEIFRLTWDEIDLSRGFIEIKAAKSKTAQRRLVHMADNLRLWLAPFAGKTGPVWPGRAPGSHGCESNWRAAIMPVRLAAKITDWPDNGLRHSFASYHLAKHSNANALALEMGHTTTKLIFAHYRELVRPEDAERYWNIRPPDEANVVPMEATGNS